MKLFLTQGWTGTEKFIKDKPEGGEVSKLLKSLNWNDFNSIRLQKDSENWIDVSGDLDKNGLAIVSEENGIAYVSYKAPQSINQLDEALNLYLKNDPALKEKWFKNEQSKTRNYESWRKQFFEQQRASKKNLKYAIFGGVIIAGFVIVFLYLLFSDELKFIGHDTIEVTATVVKIEVIPAYRGLRQSIKYRFVYDKETFIGYFIAGRSETRYKERDKVRIKIAINDPTISKKIGRLKTKYNISF